MLEKRRKKKSDLILICKILWVVEEIFGEHIADLLLHIFSHFFVVANRSTASRAVVVGCFRFPIGVDVRRTPYGGTFRVSARVAVLLAHIRGAA
ncbi:hypothetical protein V6N12_069914 [Hibiscus sabdariffa]|uniref:Secreted protein n=1 Tax=Hibiscus sabdariffa TaxID=183260 RepID=A0ABR2FF93_9ROSI